LVERQLAQRLKISIVPLRDSLARLHSEGLIERVPYSANYVRECGEDDVREICMMRILLEPPATRLAAQRAGKKLLSRLRSLCARMRKYGEARDLDEMAGADAEFHRTIVAASGNQRLIRAYDYSHIRLIQVQPWRRDAGEIRGDTTAAEHQEFIELIERGEERQAERLAHRHAWDAMRVCERVFELELGLDWLSPKD
jgi:DNA-binding GntR family transcriptional regulator